MLAEQQSFRGAVAALLSEILAHCRTAIVNDYRAWSTGERGAAVAQTPREIDVVAGSGEHRIEPADLFERRLFDRHIAAAQLRQRVVARAHLTRRAGRGCDRRRDSRAGGRREVRAAGGGSLAEHGFHQMV